MSSLGQLLEDRNFVDEVRTERQRRAAAAAPPPAAAPARPAVARAYGITSKQLEALCKSFATVLKEYVAKELAEAPPNAQLEALLARLDGLIILHESRIKNLEADTTMRGLSWAGNHEAGKTYRAGEFCKRAGSVWLAVKDTTSAPGMAPDEWELVVRGQAQP